MNRRDYAVYVEGEAAAASGAGLSDSPYGGRDGFLWREGVQAWMDENDAETGLQGRGNGLAETWQRNCRNVATGGGPQTLGNQGASA